LKGRKLCDGKLLSHARKKHHVLMEGNNPVTGKWNYDKENRKSYLKK
jgi:deoxyribodipyrimidine photolyase-related protein